MLGNRFKRVYDQTDNHGVVEVWVDRETGVNYVFRQNAYGGGFCVLVDANGKPVVTKD